MTIVLQILGFGVGMMALAYCMAVLQCWTVSPVHANTRHVARSLQLPVVLLACWILYTWSRPFDLVAGAIALLVIAALGHWSPVR